VDITLNSALNIDPLKGEKVKLKVGGAREKAGVRRESVWPGGYGTARANAAGGSRLAAESGGCQQAALLAVYRRKTVPGR
jgi:hypothetical protein